MMTMGGGSIIIIGVGFCDGWILVQRPITCKLRRKGVMTMVDLDVTCAMDKEIKIK